MRRGLGPSRQSEPLQLEGVATLPSEQLSEAEPLVRDGPVGPWNLAVLGVYFILREIEISLSLASSITLNFALKIVSWLLPSSKTDCSALTTTREWHCLCEANTIWLCPFHAAVRQLEFLKERFGDKDGNLPAGLPFFPTRGGAAAVKETVVETFKEWHRPAEIAVVDSDNNELLGGHSMRTGGANPRQEGRALLFLIEPKSVGRTAARYQACQCTLARHQYSSVSFKHVAAHIAQRQHKAARKGKPTTRSPTTRAPNETRTEENPHPNKRRPLRTRKLASQVQLNWLRLAPQKQCV